MAKTPVQRFEDTAANWAARNPVLPRSWEGIESDTGNVKLGDGVTLWNSLTYSQTAMSVFDIRSYGAKVDGVTDDFPAILAACQACRDAFGGIVYFPAGTTRVKSGTNAILNFAANQGVMIWQGSSSESVIKVDPIGANALLYLGNASGFVCRDLFFVGGDNGATGSSAPVETSYGWLIISTTWQAVFENVWFIGMGTSGNGVWFDQCRSITFRDTFFGGCTAPNSGVVYINAASSVNCDGIRFVDYHGFKGVLYAKGSVAGISQNWIKALNPLALNGVVTPATVIRNAWFDEAYGVSAIQLTGVAAAAAVFENISINGGAGGSVPSIITTTFNKVTLRDVWAGLNANVRNSLSATDVAQVEIDGLIHDDGVTDIKLLGTTKRLKLRNCQDVTITNTAAAFIDADQAMPATASAAAFAPLGAVTHVTGGTAITSFTTTNLRPGDVIKLIFDGTATLTDGNNIKAAGNLVATADDIWTGVFDGTNVYEIGRSVN